MNIGTLLSKGISCLLHPVFLPVIALMIMMQGHFAIPDVFFIREIWILMMAVVIITILCPLLMIYIFFRLHLVSSLKIEKREERVFPLLATGVFYYLAYFLLKGIPYSMLFSYFMLGATFLVILALFLNFFYKISLHMIGIGGITGFWIGLNIRQGTQHEYFLSSLILISGLMGYARFKEGDHTQGEVYSGFFLGAGIMFLLTML